MFCPIGTPVLAAAAGRVVDTGDSIAPATGRYVTIDLDDGRRVRYLHLSRRVVKIGDRVSRGQTVAYSGASGYGEEDWSWNVAETGGAHVHMTLWPTQRYVFGTSGTLDPEPFFDAGGFAGISVKPFEEDDMFSEDDRARAKNIENILAGLQNAVGDPNHGVAVAAVEASERAGNAANIASEVRNLILDPKVGILQAIGKLDNGGDRPLADAGDVDLAAIASAVADEQDRRARERLSKGA
nr:M23 family metallopeptidase [Microbacterium proteolyticum]